MKISTCVCQCQMGPMCTREWLVVLPLRSRLSYAANLSTKVFGMHIPRANRTKLTPCRKVPSSCVWHTHRCSRGMERPSTVSSSWEHLAIQRGLASRYLYPASHLSRTNAGTGMLRGPLRDSLIYYVLLALLELGVSILW